MTDGNTIFELVKGPVQILSITYDDSGAKARVLGIYVRPIGPSAEPFDSATSYPPADASEWLGAVPVDNAVLSGPAVGESHSDFELLIGYQIQDAGRYVRTNIIIKFRYDHKVLTLTHPSWIALCAGETNEPPCGAVGY